MKLELPIGTEDFVTAREKYYVDKTGLIKEIIDKSFSSSILLTRPRRFGKTLAVSMLECFFDLCRDSSALFSDLEIGKNKDLIEKYMNAYPVIRLNMKDIFGRDENEITDCIIDKITLLFRKFDYLVQSPYLSTGEKEEYAAIAERNAKPYLLFSSLQRLSLFLYKHHQKKVVLLIDEYDCPIEKAYEKGCYERIMEFVKPIYSSALKGNDALLFGFVTGVLQIGKESLFSGLNNLMIASVNDSFLRDYFGFNEKEINSLISYYDLPIESKDLFNWYGGYGLSTGEELCNPWSILNYAFTKIKDCYWVNTGSNDILSDVFSKKDLQTLPLDLIGVKIANLNTIKEVNYKTFQNNGMSLLSFLIQTGYVTVERRDGHYWTRIANEEVRIIFYDEIIQFGKTNGEFDKAKQLRKALLEANNKRIGEILEEYVLYSFSYYDLKEEKDYQNLTTGILAILFEEYHVKSEVNVGAGRCDIQMLPKEKGIPGILLEFKHSKSEKAPSKTNLMKMAENAVIQIKKQDYLEEMRKFGVEIIYLYGLGVHGKKAEISFEEVRL